MDPGVLSAQVEILFIVVPGVKKVFLVKFIKGPKIEMPLQGIRLESDSLLIGLFRLR